MIRRYTCGPLSFVATLGPDTWTISVTGAGQGDTWDVSEYQRYPLDGETYQRDGYPDLGAWIIAGLLSESPFWAGLATYDDSAERFVLEVTP